MAYNIGGMLAQSGQGIGQSIGMGLGNVGASIGTGVSGLLTRRKERQAQQSAQEQFQQILGAYQTNPAGMMREAQDALMSPDENIRRMGAILMKEAERLTKAQAATAQAQSLAALQQSISDSAIKLNLPEVAERAQSTTDAESLRAIQKDLRAQEIKNVIRQRGEPGRKALAKRYGITYEPYMGELTDENFFKVLEGQEAELKSFILPDGTETLLEVNKRDAKVKDPADGVFKRASELGLRRAPNRQQVENIANYTSELLAEAGVKHFQELHESTSQTIATLNNIEEVLPLTDEMITGATAQPELFVRRIKSELSEFLGIDADDPALQNTEAYIALAAPRVAEIIKNFGAGTGLSDADREFANKAAAGDIAMTAASLQRILKILKKAGENKVDLYNRTVKEMGVAPGAYGFVLPSRTKKTPPTTQDVDTVDNPPSGFVRD
jgi:hypothetical protein